LRKNDKNPEQSSFMSYLGLGLNIAITILIFVMIGYFVDKKFSTIPIFTITGSVAGFLTGMSTLYKTIKQVSHRKPLKQ